MGPIVSTQDTEADSTKLSDLSIIDPLEATSRPNGWFHPASSAPDGIAGLRQWGGILPMDRLLRNASAAAETALRQLWSIRCAACSAENRWMGCVSLCPRQGSVRVPRCRGYATVAPAAGRADADRLALRKTG
jgi:hypothetical protein